MPRRSNLEFIIKPPSRWSGTLSGVTSFERAQSLPKDGLRARNTDYSSDWLVRTLNSPTHRGRSPPRSKRQSQGIGRVHRPIEQQLKKPAPPLLPVRGAPDPPSFAWRPDPAAFHVVAVFRPALDIVARPPYVTVAVPVPMSRLPDHRSTGWRRDNFRARRRDRRVGGRRWLSARAADPNHADSRTDNKPLHRQSPQSRPRDATPTRNLKWLIVTAR
jgi:hypothetical protein